GLVMLGAIETNQSQVDLGKTTPISTMTTESEAIVVPAKSKYKTLRDIAGRPQARPGLDPLGGRLGRLDRPAARRRAGARARRRPGEDEVRRPLRGRRGERLDSLRLRRRGLDRPVGGHRPGEGGQDAPARGPLAG